MSKITDLISSLKSMELPKGAESLLSSIGTEASTLEADRDDLKTKVQTRQTENDRLKTRAQDAEAERDVLKAKVPEGGVILSSQDAREYEALRALGKPAKDLKDDLERGATAQKTAHNATNRERLRELGYEPTDRLLRDFEGVSINVSEGADKKKAGKVKAGDDESDFTTWAKAQGLDSDLERYRVVTLPDGVIVLPQKTGDTTLLSATAQTAQSFQAARDSAPNPLLGGTQKDGTKN